MSGCADGKGKGKGKKDGGGGGQREERNMTEGEKERVVRGKLERKTKH